MVNKKLEDTPQMPLDEREQHRKRQELITPFRPSQKWRLFLWQIWRWTGFGEKKLWDLLQLVIIPLVLWGLSYGFNQKATIREQKAAKEANRQEALTSYIDNLPTLLQDANNNRDKNVVRGLAQAKTSTTLQLLKDDPERREILLDFLRVSGLLGTFQDSQSPKVIGPILEGINLKNRVLEGADLHQANLKGADLRKADLVDAILNNANLSGANLSKANLTRASLPKANLRGAYLMEADLRGANLEGANLIGADFNKAKIGESFDTKGDRKNTNFKNAFYTEGGINNAQFYIGDSSKPKTLGEEYKNAMLSIKPDFELPSQDTTSPPQDFFSYTDLSSVTLTDASLTGVNLTGANLQKTDFSKAILVNSNLSSANLSSANLSSANLSGANLKGADLTKANLGGAIGISPEILKKQAILCQTTMPDGTKNSDGCPSPGMKSK
jgi:uncharacterized protein YjbI with pentapeptide repeats